MISGLPDLNPDKVGQIHNVVKDATQFGNQIEHWDGFDITATGRFPKLIIQGGVSSGRRLTDNCAVRGKGARGRVPGGGRVHKRRHLSVLPCD